MNSRKLDPEQVLNLTDMNHLAKLLADQGGLDATDWREFVQSGHFTDLLRAFARGNLVPHNRSVLRGAVGGDSNDLVSVHRSGILYSCVGTQQGHPGVLASIVFQETPTLFLSQACRERFSRMTIISGMPFKCCCVRPNLPPGVRTVRLWDICVELGFDAVVTSLDLVWFLFSEYRKTEDLFGATADYYFVLRGPIAELEALRIVREPPGVFSFDFVPIRDTHVSAVSRLFFKRRNAITGECSLQ